MAFAGRRLVQYVEVIRGTRVVVTVVYLIGVEECYSFGYVLCMSLLEHILLLKSLVNSIL